jgi:small-conductance mechanosensitive channel
MRRPATLALFALCVATASMPHTLAAQSDTARRDSVVRADSPAVSAPSASRPDTADAPEPVSVQRAIADERTRSDLQALFDRIPSLSGITVSVDAGVVRLEGIVVEPEARAQAARLAESMDDVRFVDNRIGESTSLEEQLRPTWARLRELMYGTLAKLPLLVVAIVIVALAAVAGSLLARWRGPSILQARNPFLQGLIRRALQAAIVVFGLLLALDLLGATALVGAVVGTAGLAGLAVGLAFKDIAENYLAGTLLALRQPFAQNDQIQVGTFEGKVVRLTPRETILMTADGNHVRLPNAMIFRSPLVNFTRNPLRRFEFEAGIGTGDDLVRARDVGVAALLATEGVLREPPPQVLVTALGDSTVTVSFSGWLDQHRTEYLRVRSEAIRMVKTRLEASGLTMPSPEFLVEMHGEQGDAISSDVPPRVAGALRTGRTAPAAATHGASDVSVDRTLDEQIAADRRHADEADLLDATGTKPGTAAAPAGARPPGTPGLP